MLVSNLLYLKQKQFLPSINISAIQVRSKYLMFWKKVFKFIGRICSNIFILSPTTKDRFFIPGLRGANRVKTIDFLWMGHQSIADLLL